MRRWKRMARSSSVMFPRLHPTRHQVDLAGMPVGYSVTSVRVGSEDALTGLSVGNGDISGIVITVSAPKRLPRIRGMISGLPAGSSASTKVQLTGPIIGGLEASVQPDGSFEFPTVIPGAYTLKLTQVPQVAPVSVMVAGWDTTDVRVSVPPR